MSDFAAVAESDRFPAKWAAGDAKENELVLSADFGEGTFLSGSVWESAEGDEKPWHCIFRFSQEDMGSMIKDSIPMRKLCLPLRGTSVQRDTMSIR